MMPFINQVIVYAGIASAAAQSAVDSLASIEQRLTELEAFHT